jgi:hypothetical protein
MSVDLSTLSSIFWIIFLLVGVMIVLGILGFIFRHIFHWFARGCGCIGLVLLAVIVLKVFKLF